MAIRTLYFTYIAVVMLLTARSTRAVCGDDQTYAFVNIPDSNTLMSWKDFDTFVVGTKRAEVYYGIPKPTDPAIRNHVFTTVTKEVGTSNYIENLYCETAEAIPTCKRLTVTHTPLPGSDRAIFFFEQSTEYYWSSCPAKYYWYMYCASYSPTNRKCKFADSELALYVNGTLDDAPMVDIVRDLCKGADVKFGATSFKWFFTYGENKLCA